MSDTPEVLTPAQAAALLQVPERTVQRLAKQGRLPASKIGVRWRFHRDQLLAWMQGGTAPQTPLPPMAALFVPERMQLRMKATTREAAVQELLPLVGAEDTRELAGSSTLFPTGAVLLHPGRAVPERVKKPVVVYGRSLDGVAFGTAGLTKLFFLVCAPSEALHAGLVAAVKGLCQDAAFCKEVYLQNAPEGVVRTVSSAKPG